MERLRDCPFCGAKASIQCIQYSGFAYVECEHSKTCLIRYTLLPVYRVSESAELARKWNGGDYDLIKAREDDLK